MEAKRLWNLSDLRTKPLEHLDANDCRTDKDAEGRIIAVYGKNGTMFRPLAGYYNWFYGEIQDAAGRRWLGAVDPSDSTYRYSYCTQNATGWLKGKPGVTLVGVMSRTGASSGHSVWAISNYMSDGTTAITTQAQQALTLRWYNASQVYVGYRRTGSDTRALSTLTTGLPAAACGWVCSQRFDATNAKGSTHMGPANAWGPMEQLSGVTTGNLLGFSNAQYQVMLGAERASLVGSALMSLGEFLIFDEALSDDDLSKLEGFLAHKWGVQDSMPSSHPYRYAQPIVTWEEPDIQIDDTRFLKYVALPGDTWDSIAFANYYSEFEMDRLLESNPEHIDTIIFKGGETIRIPLVSQSALSASTSVSPWSR